MGSGLLNYRWVFSAGRFLQSAIASSMSNPQLGGPVIRMFQLLPPGVPHIWNNVSEPQQQKVELWARNCREFCRKWWLPHHFWVLLHVINLWHGTDSFTSLRGKACWRFFRPKNPTCFGQVWTHELGYQRPARLPLDHQSRFNSSTNTIITVTMLAEYSMAPAIVWTSFDTDCSWRGAHQCGSAGVPAGLTHLDRLPCTMSIYTCKHLFIMT